MCRARDTAQVVASRGGMMFDASDNPVALLCVLFALGLLPLVACCLTSYLKLSIVFNIARSGFGVQGIPPAFVTALLSIALTLRIMTPVMAKIAAEIDRTELVKKLSAVTSASGSMKSDAISIDAGARKGEGRGGSKNRVGSKAGRRYAILAPSKDRDNSGTETSASLKISSSTKTPTSRPKTAKPKTAKPLTTEHRELENSLIDSIRSCLEPLEEFLKAHALAPERRFFRGAGVNGTEFTSSENSENLATLAPAFIVSEMGAGFRIGLVLLLPFIVIDLVVANVLIALGLTLVNPVSISLPIKLALFGMTDGWLRICQALIRTYGGES